jgi:hypothetical protein
MSDPVLENAVAGLDAPLRWRPTRFPPDPPKVNDGVALDGEEVVGRVSPSPSPVGCASRLGWSARGGQAAQLMIR